MNKFNARLLNSRAAPLLIAGITFAAAGNAGAAGDGFDTSTLESTSTAVLGVGALIAVGFAVFKIGKRAMNKV